MSESRIETIFSTLRSEGRRGLAPFIVGGRPSVEETARLLPALQAAGASIVEVGIPFSDPIADGPVIAAAMHKALESGVHTRDVLNAVQRARSSCSLGIVAMASVSLAQRVGVARFVGEAKDAGIDGFIFPDAPLEEAPPLVEAVREVGLTASLLVAPTTPRARAEKIVGLCSGFVYLMARLGITGESAAAPEIGARVAELREMTDLPIACGFGVSKAEHVRAVVEHADAAIVGSALVRRIEDAAERGEDAAEAAGAFVRELGVGLKDAGAAA
ncbi:MAG: tryptophan synthase subunit alpha [Phycisphaeraceae bacterium]|nr:MAG: tryptophan synthase subunit alpha [Phycisphaeraceae bacterium]